MNAPDQAPTAQGPKDPSMNARKHGFAGKHVAAHTLERAETLRIGLERARIAMSREELDVIADLAIAQARVEEIQIALDERIADEKRHAADLIESRLLQHFTEERLRWIDDPALYAQILGKSYHGAAYFADLWAEVAEAVGPEGLGLTALQARQAAMALGSPWQLSRVRGDGAWLMARFVRAARDPEAVMRQWVRESGTADDDMDRARRLAAKAPEPAAARRELHARATAERDRWIMQRNALRIDYETALARAPEQAIGTGLGDRCRAHEFRLTLRYLTAARNEAAKLQRRLDALKRNRPLNTHRAEKKATREASRVPHATSCKTETSAVVTERSTEPTPEEIESNRLPVDAIIERQMRKWENRTNAIKSEMIPASSALTTSSAESTPAAPQMPSLQRLAPPLRNGAQPFPADRPRG
jgi:hypothetical protein